MINPELEFMSWENLKQQIIVVPDKQIKTNNLIIDEVFKKAVYWKLAPSPVIEIIEKFNLYQKMATSPNHSNLGKSLEFTTYEINILKWYVGQWIAAQYLTPDRWDEKLNQIKSPEELILFIEFLGKYSIRPFW